MKRPSFAPLALGAVLTLLVGTSLPRIAAAQDAATAASPAPAASGHRHHRGGGFYKTLGLSADQKKQIKTIMRTAREKNKDADPATKRASRAATMAQIRAVLTPEQQAKFDAHVSAMRAQHGSGAK